MLEQKRILNRLGEYIKNKRKERGLSQDKLSWACEVTARCIQKLENSTSKNPKLFTLLKVCEGLKVDMDHAERGFLE